MSLSQRLSQSTIHTNDWNSSRQKKYTVLHELKTGYQAAEYPGGWQLVSDS